MRLGKWKTIEARPRDMSMTWFPVVWTLDNKWQFDKFDYRVKPEPREWRVWEDKRDESLRIIDPSYHVSWACFKVREVLE